MHEEYNDNHCRMPLYHRCAFIRDGITPRAVEYSLAKSESIAVAARRLNLDSETLKALMNDWGITATAARKALGIRK